MPEDQTARIDVLDLLATRVDDLIEALTRADGGSGYIDGQLAYLEAVAEAIDEAGASTTPGQLLEGVAGDLGLSLVDGEIDPTPATQREAGILSMWSLCLGYVEGIAHGVRDTMAFVDDVEGAHGMFDAI